MTLLYLCLSFIAGVYAGVYLGSALHVPTEVALLAAVLPAAVALLWWRQAGVRTIALCGLAVLVGLARYPAAIPPPLADYNGKGTLTVRAQVVEDPDVRDRLVYLKASASQVRLGDNWQPVSGLLQVYVPLYPRYQYGDDLELLGQLEEPPVFEDFSYKDYLARQGVYSVMQRPRVIPLNSNVNAYFGDRQNPLPTPTAMPIGDLCILAFNDMNGDGQWKAPERPLAGALITVTNLSGTLVITRTTDATEPYCFFLEPGIYTVTEQNPADYPYSSTPDVLTRTVVAGRDLGDPLQVAIYAIRVAIYALKHLTIYTLKVAIYALQAAVYVAIYALQAAVYVAIYALKHRAQDIIAQTLPEPHAGLLMGILLGVKAALPEDLKNDLSTLGLTHIVVVSGFNLTVIAGALQRGTSRLLGRRWSMLLGLIGVVLFTLMVGASAAVVRAAIMVSLAVLATALGRQSDALTSLALAAALMVAKNPMTLWDVGFQLSVAATTGLVVLSPILESWLPTLPAVIRSPLAVAVAAQLMTVPIIAYNFHRVSLISPLANLLVLPVVPWMMLFGAIVVFVGFLAIPVASAIGWLVWLFSAYAVSVMHLLASLPFAAVPTPPLAAYWSWVYYGLLALAFYLAIRRPASLRQSSQAAVATLRRLPTWVLIGGLLIVAVLVWAAVVLQLAAR